MNVAALPQHFAQVAGIALGTCFVFFGVLAFLKGPPPDLRAQISPRLLRVFAPFAIVLGIAVAAVFFFVDAGSPNDDDQWGGAWGVSMLVVWLAVLTGIAIHNLRRYRNSGERTPDPPRR